MPVKFGKNAPPESPPPPLCLAQSGSFIILYREDITFKETREVKIEFIHFISLFLPTRGNIQMILFRPCHHPHYYP